MHRGRAGDQALEDNALEKRERNRTSGQTRCIVPSIMALLFGIFGAIGAVLYWEYTAALPDDSLARLFQGSIYATFGFVLGWIIGFVLNRLGPD